MRGRVFLRFFGGKVFFVCLTSFRLFAFGFGSGFFLRSYRFVFFWFVVFRVYIVILGVDFYYVFKVVLRVFNIIRIFLLFDKGGYRRYYFILWMMRGVERLGNALEFS